MSRTAVVSLLIAGTCVASADATTRWTKPVPALGFNGVRQELQRLVNEHGYMRVNHFCLVVRDVQEAPDATSEGNDRVLLIHWREGRQILSYGPTDGAPLGPENQDAGASIDLANDVVASERDINGSIKRVTRRYVDGVIARCRANGSQYVITRRSHRQ